MRQTEKMKKADWERTNQIPTLVENALYPFFRGRLTKSLPTRRELEAGIRLRLRGNFKFNHIDIIWPSREQEVADALMETEDPVYMTVVVRPWCHKKVVLKYTMSQLGLREKPEDDYYEDHGTRYPEDMDTGDGLNSGTYPPVGAEVYNKDYDDHFERAFGEQSPSMRERKLDDWEWRFAKQWVRGRGA